MDEQTLGRYLDLKQILKDNREEMKPLRKELKEIEEEIIESGLNEFDYYGVKIVIASKDREKLNKDKAEELVTEAIHEGKGKFNDFYDVTTIKKVKITNDEK